MPTISNANNPLVRVIALNLLDDPGLRPWSHASALKQPLGLDQRDASALRSTCKDLHMVLAEPKDVQYDRICRKASKPNMQVGPMAYDSGRLGRLMLEVCDKDGMHPYQFAEAINEMQFISDPDQPKRSTLATRKMALGLMLLMQAEGNADKISMRRNFDVIDKVRARGIDNIFQYCYHVAPDIYWDGFLAGISLATAGLGIAGFTSAVRASESMVESAEYANLIVGCGYITLVGAMVGVPMTIGVAMDFGKLYEEHRMMRTQPDFYKDALMSLAIILGGIDDMARTPRNLFNGRRMHEPDHMANGLEVLCEGFWAAMDLVTPNPRALPAHRRPL